MVVYLDEAAFISWLGERTRPRERLRARLRSRTTSVRQLLHGAYDGRAVASRVPANGSRLQSIGGRPRLVDVDDFSTAKCASDCPALVACFSHWGISPLPSHVSPKALRYRADFWRALSWAIAAATSPTLMPTLAILRRRYAIILWRFCSSMRFPLRNSSLVAVWCRLAGALCHQMIRTCEVSCREKLPSMCDS